LQTDPRVVRDQLVNAHPEVVAHASFKVIDQLQTFPKGVQVAAAGVLLLELCRKWGIHPSAVFEIVNNIINDQLTIRPEFGAIRKFVAEQL